MNVSTEEELRKQRKRSAENEDCLAGQTVELIYIDSDSPDKDKEALGRVQRILFIWIHLRQQKMGRFVDTSVSWKQNMRI